jgi:hypothetical protein
MNVIREGVKRTPRALGVPEKNLQPVRVGRERSMP